ncbi:alpha/beta hydrolase [Nocardioides pacificus]
MTQQLSPSPDTSAAQAASYTSISFDSHGTRCDAWHFPAASDALAGPAGRPVVVMAHGLGGTKDSGLAPFAQALAAAGLDVLAFDYRGFGASDGSPRQLVSAQGQVEDYRAAMQAAARLDGVDPKRLVLWGVSLAGGHVLAAGAHRDDVAAVISLTPLVDGVAAGRLALKHHKPTQLLRSTAAGIRGKVAARTGRDQVLIPLVAPPGELGALTLDGALEDYLSIAGPTWRNEIDASVALELGGVRPAKQAADLRAPLLVQIADFDRSAPPYAAAQAGFAGHAEVRHYPCDHFDVWPGKAQFERVVAHQVAFLQRKLAPSH